MCLTPEEMSNMLRKTWEKEAMNIKGYHIHAYAGDKPQDIFTARHIASILKSMFPDDVEGVYEVGVVGPHSAPNIEIDIKPESFGRIVSWLQVHNYGLSILVHPETGDDLKDHLQNSMWINRETAYNQTFFEKLQAKQNQPPVPKHGL